MNLTRNYFVFVLTLLFFTSTVLAQSGKIIGYVYDKSTGEELIGSNVLIEGTMMGAATDINGAYTINNIPAGTYTVIGSMIGFNKMTVTGVEVKADEVTTLNFEIGVEAIETEEVVVTAAAVEDSEAGLLKHRQKSIAISDAISAELISRSGGSNAADAMKRVTGAAVIGGKHVNVRGLGDRYNSTHLNGAELPSSDPDKKSFHLDIFPANLLENIITVKSFTPDKAGNFSGGLVDLTTKKYPESFSFKISASAGYNSLSSFNGNFLSYSLSGTDWLGFDDGMRDIPALLADPNLELPTPNAAGRDATMAYLLDEATRAFDPEMTPSTRKPAVDNSYSIAMADQLTLFGRPLGYVISGSYSRKYKSYDGGTIARWDLSGPVDMADELNRRMNLSDAKGSDEVLLGGLVTLAYKPHDNHDISFNMIMTQSGESSARSQIGEWDDQFSAENTKYQTRSLLYTERTLESFQFQGEHFLAPLAGAMLKWNASFGTSIQNEPDLRFFSNHFEVEDGGDTTFVITKQFYNLPTRFYRDLEESNDNFSADLSIPITQWDGLSGKVKFGGSHQKTDREFRERRFEYDQQLNLEYDGNPETYFVTNAGIQDSSRRYLFGTHLVDASRQLHNYDGDQEVNAGFLMLELPLSQTLRFIGGARYETTKIDVVSQDSSAQQGNLDNKDWLPSINLIYSLLEDVNVRASYGKTLARPTFRELAPFRSFEFLGDALFQGNADLKRTLIDNFDLRTEWFMRPGELLAVSGFYKKFTNPIERTIDPAEFTIQYQNIDEGYVYGAEIELRKRLDEIHESLMNFYVNMNLSLVYSEVEIPGDEFENNIKPFDPGAENTRPLYGQSPYIFNLEVAYENLETSTFVGLYFNIFGERLSDVTLGHLPDVYEQPRGILDFSVSQKIYDYFNVRFTAKNILDTDMRKVITYKDVEYDYETYTLGRSFSLSVSYSL